MTGQLRPALALLAGFTLLTGIAYPLAMTAFAGAVFPDRAGGSLIVRDGRVLGSHLVGQEFSSERFFWGRPSATSPHPYNAAASAASNLGTKNPALAALIARRRERLVAAHPGAGEPPTDLLTASASGLDPHISPAAALYQCARVARARGLDPARLRVFVESRIEGRIALVLGEPRVNVLELNLALESGPVSN